MYIEYLIPHKHTLKFLCKSKHFSRRYKRKREWVFFSEHSVELRGRARREATRRRKYEWKVNLGIRNSSRSNGNCQMTPKIVSFFIVEPRGIWTCVSLQCTSSSGGYMRTIIKSLFVDQSSSRRLVVRIPPLTPKL